MIRFYFKYKPQYSSSGAGVLAVSRTVDFLDYFCVIFLPRDAMHKGGVHLYVCLSVTFVYSVKTSKQNLQTFHRLVSS